MAAHHHRRQQRIARRATIALAVLALAIGVPLMLMPALRLRIAQQVGLVPGREATRLFGPDEATELIVLTEEVPVEFSLPTRRYTAAFVAERTGDAVVLHDLASPRRIDIPLPRYDLIATSDDRRALLFVDRSEPGPSRAVLVETVSGEVRPLPSGETDPGIPGEWASDLSLSVHIDCSGASPRGTWVACIRHGRAFSPYLFGNWELQVHPFGRARDTVGLYRGRGSDPIVGWSADETALYFQNETGVWRIAVPAAEL
jgi:hypothetical protein